MIGDRFSDDWAVEPRTGYRLRTLAAGDRAVGVALALPEGAPPEGGFPLLMLSDAALHFDAAAASAAALARRPAKTGVGPMIVVGIANGPGWGHDGARREQDLVPGEPGAEALHALIREQLLPEIAALAPVDRRRSAFLGHSLGALFALDIVARAPGEFGRGIAISPSFWRLPDFAGCIAPAFADRQVRLLLASGEKEPAKINEDLPAMADLLGQHAQVERRLLADEDHGSTPFAMMPAALRFVHAA